MWELWASEFDRKGGKCEIYINAGITVKEVANSHVSLLPRARDRRHVVIPEKQQLGRDVNKAVDLKRQKLQYAHPTQQPICAY
jgi:hypothetical protein